MMQAIIMAAGKGSRLGTLTMGKPKSFAEIHGKKLIEYNLKLLQKYKSGCVRSTPRFGTAR